MSSDWSNLCEDLLRKIAKLVDPVDRKRFIAVCKWLRFIAKSECDGFFLCPPPWLMLAENPNRPSKRCFVGLSKNMDNIDEDISFEVDFPQGCGSRCVGSIGAWLIMVDQKLGVHLRNPLTQDHVELPPISTFGPRYDPFVNENGVPVPMALFREFFIHKAILRWLPQGQDEHEHEDYEDFIVIAIYHYSQSLAFTKRDSKSWTTIQMDFAFSDVIFSKAHAKFYGVGGKGGVVEIDDDIEGGPKARKVFDSLMTGEWNTNLTRSYLVECEGQVLQVIKFVDWLEEECNYKTCRFRVYALDTSNVERTELKSLGRHSLFVGDNTSVALSTCQDSFNTFSGKSIYFTDDFRLGYRGFNIEGGKDVGVFDLKTANIKPYCKRISLSYFSPPSWIIPAASFT